VIGVPQAVNWRRHASSEELFHHAYRDGLQAIELSRAENEVELKTVLADPQAGLPRRILFEEYDKTIRAVLKSLTPSSPDAESVLRGSLNALRLVEELRFIFANLLEAVKRDDSLHNSFTRYRDLGLIDNVNLTDIQDEKRTSPWLFNRDSGQLLPSEGFAYRNGTRCECCKGRSKLCLTQA
jgi:hypothetical protein